MQLSYSVIKKNFVNPQSVYSIKAAPPVKTDEHIEKEDTLKECEAEEVKDEGPSIEEIKAYAQNIINEASKKAKAIIDSAGQQAERIKKEAYSAAFKKGYAEGLEKGTKEGLTKVEDIRKQAEDVLVEAHRVSREYIDGRRQEIVNLALSIAEKIIRCQVDLNDGAVSGVVSEAIKSAVIKGRVTIMVNPLDYPFVDNMKDELAKLVEGSAIVSIIKDSSIKRGGCKIETDVSSVDATIDNQLQKIKEALLG